MNKFKNPKPLFAFALLGLALLACRMIPAPVVNIPTLPALPTVALPGMDVPTLEAPALPTLPSIEFPTLVFPTLPPLFKKSGSTPQPGLLVKGTVLLADGTGLEGVTIYRAYASYSGTIIATTGPDGTYQGQFQPIPGDEMVRVWAELKGYTFSDPQNLCEKGICSWRHYYGYEEREINFIAKPVTQ